MDFNADQQQSKMSGKEVVDEKDVLSDDQQPKMSGIEVVEEKGVLSDDQQPKMSGNEMVEGKGVLSDDQQPKMSGNEMVEGKGVLSDDQQPKMSGNEMVEEKGVLSDDQQPKMSGNEVVDEKGMTLNDQHTKMSTHEENSVKEVLPDDECCIAPENFYFFCNKCASIDQQTEAQGFCANCGKYLCWDCVRHHKKVIATKMDIIQDIQQVMSEEANGEHQIEQHVCMEPCDKHYGKILEYYCEKHDELACSMCMTIGHITCGMGYIPEISEGTTNSEEFRNLFAEVEDNHEIFKSTKNRCKDLISATELKSQAYTEEVIQFGEDIISHVKDLVKRAINEKDKLVKEILDGLRNSQEQSEKIYQEMSSMKAELETKQDSESQSFVLMKMLQLKLKEKSGTLCQTVIDSKSTVFEFVENSYLKCIKSIQDLGTLRRYKKVVKRYEDINISIQENEEVPIITGIEVLPDGRLGMVDCENHLVKLVDTKNKTVSEIQFESQPIDLSVVSNGQLVVTLPDKGEIQFLNVADKFSLGRVIRTDKECMVIVACQDKLIVGIWGKSVYIKILDMTGRVLRKITTGQNGELLFTYPEYIAASIGRNVFYVSDSDDKKVTCLTLEGAVKAVYSDKSLGEPYGIAIDEDGSAYVCGEDSIHHITSNGNKIQILLDQPQDGADSMCIAYDKNSKKLYLAGWHTSLKVYQLG